MMLMKNKDNDNQYKNGKKWIIISLTATIVVLGSTGTVLANETITEVNVTRMGKVRDNKYHENESAIYKAPVDDISDGVRIPIADTAGMRLMVSKMAATSQLTTVSVADGRLPTTNLRQVKERQGFWLQVASILLLGLMTYAGDRKRVADQ
ncbi:hypothetical protein [Lactiplantibacillus daowaiensis]|uniref:Cell surface protein n=1 Tax=Lactiplantibacillus daowaiensis TaxID=2559918 RepID=A0ABW1RYJ0_9LACO|nr:hypothetical protein [Lactiplantibacillus daowaiensis]